MATTQRFPPTTLHSAYREIVEWRAFAGVRVYSAALLTLGAGVIHLAVAPQHSREYVRAVRPVFVAVGAAHIVLAAELVFRPTRRLALLLTGGTITLVVLWFVFRTVGLPIGPSPGRPEVIGLTDGLHVATSPTQSIQRASTHMYTDKFIPLPFHYLERAPDDWRLVGTPTTGFLSASGATPGGRSDCQRAARRCLSAPGSGSISAPAGGVN